MSTRLRFALGLLASLGLHQLANSQTRQLIGVMYPIPPSTTSGSGYTAIECGLDGKIYLGTANYGNSAHLVRFDPKTKQWDDLIDAHKVTRWNGKGLDSHSKFHAKILVDADGTIWAATKQGNEEFANRPEYAESADGYPGGHLFSYHPKTNIVTDHGILKKHNGLMGGAIDRQRRRLYYWADPSQHFLIYDMAKRTMRDLGSIGGSPRYMVIDPHGRVFLPGRKGVMCMYDPQTDALYDLAVQLQGPGTYVDPYAIVHSADGKSILACAIGGEYVMEFDLDSIRIDARMRGFNGSIVCRHVARSIPEPEKPGDQHAGVLGKDGCFYFPNGSNNELRLIRYNPNARGTDDLGVITVKDHPEVKALHPQGMCVSPDGTLWMKFISYRQTPYCIVAFEKLIEAK